ncbi:MAG: thiamine phosphate synthase [Deltaproteobacteria bacterium]|nr:thiamine phosphate synthase [Deltaproteobacteria bacterium]
MRLDDVLANARLYLIFTEELSELPLEEALPAAVAGGVDLVQIREKGDAAKRIELARRALDALAGAGTPVIVNDDPEAAVAAGAHGVHLGPEDMPPAAALKILAPGMVLGLSTTTVADALAAVKSGAHYIGVGTVFATGTKRGKTIIGPLAAARVARSVPVPAFPIGGIDAAGARELARAGLRRAAVCSAIISGRNVEERAAAIRASLEAPPPRGSRS